MDTVGEGIPSFPPPHPGPLMARVLMRNYNLAPYNLAEKSGIPLNVVQQIIDGKAEITKSICSKLKTVFGTAADRLLLIQNIHDFYELEGRRPTRDERERMPGYEAKPHGLRP